MLVQTLGTELWFLELTGTASIWRLLTGHLLVILLRAGAVRTCPVRAGALRLRGSSVLGQSAMVRAHSLRRGFLQDKNIVDAVVVPAGSRHAAATVDLDSGTAEVNVAED